MRGENPKLLVRRIVSGGQTGVDRGALDAAMALGIRYSIGGNVVIENVFGWPGLGRTLVRAVSASDFPVAQGAFLFIAIVMVAMNFLADFLYGVLDPRVGSSERAKA